jgi:hypothetical protein
MAAAVKHAKDKKAAERRKALKDSQTEAAGGDTVGGVGGCPWKVEQGGGGSGRAAGAEGERRRRRKEEEKEEEQSAAHEIWAELVRLRLEQESSVRPHMPVA